MTTQTKREPLKVGERVVVTIYGGTKRRGTVSYVSTVPDVLDVRLDEPFDKQEVWPLHTMQVRRLIPKRPRREYWVNPDFLPSEHAVCVTDLGGRLVSTTKPEQGYTRVREVRSGRKTGGSDGSHA